MTNFVLCGMASGFVIAPFASLITAGLRRWAILSWPAALLGWAAWFLFLLAFLLQASVPQKLDFSDPSGALGIPNQIWALIIVLTPILILGVLNRREKLLLWVKATGIQFFGCVLAAFFAALLIAVCEEPLLQLFTGMTLEGAGYDPTFRDSEDLQFGLAAWSGLAAYVCSEVMRSWYFARNSRG